MRKFITLLTIPAVLGLASIVVYRNFTLEKTLAQNDRPVQHRYSAYWTTAFGFESTIELHNNLVDEPLSVTPVLYTANGAAIELDEVQMGVLGSSSVKINEALAAKGVSQPQSGSAVFRYSRKFGGALSAEISVIHYQKSLAYTIPSVEDLSRASQAQHTAFWRPSKRSEVYVALQNTSDETIRVSPIVQFDGNTYVLMTITLAPNQSEELELPDDLDLTNLQQSLGWFKSEVGGITPTHDGPKGALNASGWIEDEQLGFSTMMNFFDPAVTHGRNLFATQILLGEVSEALGLAEKMKVESHLVLRNLTGQNVAALGQFFYTEGEGVQSVPLNLGELRPSEIRDIDLSRLQQQGFIPKSVTQGSLRIEHQGVDGALLGRVFSISQQKTYGFYSSLEDDASGSVSGVYWSTQNGWDSLLTIANFGDQLDEVNVQLAYNGGNVVLPKFSLAPFESKTLNTSHLRQKLENKLPKGANQGGYLITGMDPYTSKLLIKEHLLNSSLGISAPFYQTCNYVVGIYLSPASFTLNVGQQATTIPKCDWNIGPDLANPNASTYSNIPSFATITNSGSTRTLTGVAPGPIDLHHECSAAADSACTLALFTSQGGGQVRPVVTAFTGPGIVPLRASGTTTGQNSIQLGATVNPGGGSYQWSTSSSKINLSNATSSTVTVSSVVESTARGDVPFTLIYTVNGVASSPANSVLTVVRPASLSVATGYPQTSATGHTCSITPGTASCEFTQYTGGATYSSYKTTYLYSIMDHLSPAQAITGFSLALSESYGAITGACSGSPQVITGASSGSAITDCFYFCHETCRTGGSCSPSGTQTIKVNGFTVATKSVTWTCNNVTVQ